MGSDVSPGARVVRVTLLLSLLVYGFGFWVSRSLAFTDFRVLHLGGRLVNDGRAATAYDAPAFSAEAAQDPGLANTARELDVFISPPPFALAMRPFALLSSNIALVVWMVIGVLGVVGAVRLLRLPWWTSIVALVMPFGIANIYHAQTGFLAILWVAAIHRLSVDDRRAAAGAIAGLAVLKPTLLLGVALWWLLDWRRWYPALSAAFGVGTAIVAATVIGGFDQWRFFLDALAFRAALDQEVVANQPTLAEAVSRIAGTGVGAHPLALLAYCALGGAAMFMALRQWRTNTAALSGFAMLLSILISPHLLIYDTGLLLVPAAVLIAHGAPATVMERWMMVYVVSSLITIMSMGWLRSLNDWTMPGTIGLVVLSVMWARSIEKSSGSSAAGDHVLNSNIATLDKGFDGGDQAVAA